MKMSMFQVILLCVFGAFAVAGVLIFAFFVSTGTGSSIGSVTMWGTFDEVAVTTVMRQLSESDDRLRLITYVQKPQETFEQELTAALAAGMGPDLYVLRHDYAVIDAPKVTLIPPEQFSAEQFESLFIEAAEPFITRNGVIAVPLAADPLVLYWNRDLFANAGLAQPPSFWGEVQSMVRSLTRKSDSGTIEKSAIAFGEYGNVTHAKEIISMLMMQAGSPVTVRDSTNALQPALQIARGQIAQPAQSAVSFYTSFTNPTLDTYSWNRSFRASRDTFAVGDVAIYVGLASEEPLIRRQNPNLNFAIAPMPQIREAERSITGGFSYGLAVPRTSANPAGALTAAYLLASPEASKALTTAFGIASARRDVLSEPAEGTDDLFQKMAIIMRTWEDPNPQRTNGIFRDMIESISSGAAKVSEAVQRADSAMREAIQN